MQKIPTIFEREQVSKKKALCINVPTPKADWVFRGEGIPTRKHDGTACMMKAGVFYRRYDAKNSKVTPPGFIPAMDPDAETSHWCGWIPVEDTPDSQYHLEAWKRQRNLLADGTYELLGPKINGNPEGLTEHCLIPHGAVALEGVPRDFEGLRAYLTANVMEGIVWHHPDGRMAKIKRRDFDIPWPVKA